MKACTDIWSEHHQPFIIVRGASGRGKLWLEKNLTSTPEGGADVYFVEHRYFLPIAVEIMAAHLILRDVASGSEASLLGAMVATALRKSNPIKD